MSANFSSVFKQIFKNVKKSEVVVKQCVSVSSNHKQFSTAQTANTRKLLKIGVQGAGFDRGQRKPGVEKGPGTIRSSGFMEFLRDEIGHDVLDYGDIDFSLETRKSLDTSNCKRGDLRNAVEVGKANFMISKSTSKIVQDGRIPVTLGGDHSIAIGTIHGVSEVIPEPLAVLWVDAHTDINTPETSTSGNLHGMSLSFLLKELKQQNSLPEFSWVMPRISVAHLAYIGLRSVDPEEREILDRFGITAFSMRDVDRLGIVEVTRRALYKISPPGSKRPLHVSFDIDALDDLELGGGGAVTGTAVEGGLTLREGMTLLEEVHENANVVSMDLVEVNPDLGHAQAQTRTAALTKHLFGSLFGYSRGGMSK